MDDGTEFAAVAYDAVYVKNWTVNDIQLFNTDSGEEYFQGMYLQFETKDGVLHSFAFDLDDPLAKLINSVTPAS